MSDATSTGGDIGRTPPPGTPDFAAPESPWPPLDTRGPGLQASGHAAGGAPAGPGPVPGWPPQDPPTQDARPGAGAQGSPWGPPRPQEHQAAPGLPGPAGPAPRPPRPAGASDGYVAPDRDADTGRPVVTYTMMAICGALWLLTTVAPRLTGVLELVPDLALHQPWRLLTGGFLYLGGSLLDISLGLLTIWIVGQAIEPAMGRRDFLLLYLLSLLGGSAAAVLWSRASHGSLLVSGASAAIWGMFGVLVTLRPKGWSKESTSGLWVLVGLNVLYVILIPTIAWQVKLGGFLIGLAAGVLVRTRGRAGRSTRALWLLLVPIVLTLGVAALP